MMTAIDATTIPPIGHDEAMGITEVEFARMLDAARELGPADWTRPTVNTGWDVRAVMLHLLGAAEFVCVVSGRGAGTGLLSYPLPL